MYGFESHLGGRSMLNPDCSSLNPEEFIRWPEYYESLLRFSVEYGHCNVPLTKEFPLPDGTMARLGTWLENQRVLKRMGRLDQTSSVRLQALVDEGKLRWESSPDMNRHSTIFADGGKWMTALDALVSMLPRVHMRGLNYRLLVRFDLEKNSVLVMFHPR